MRKLLLLCVPLCLAGGLLAITRDTVRFAPDADEGYYFRYAVRVSNEGGAAFRPLFLDYVRDPQKHFFPPPTRLATVGLDALAVKGIGESFESLQAVSMVSFLVLLAVVFFLLCSVLGQRTAFWTTVLLAGSPLQLGLARRALSDSWVAAVSLMVLLLVWRMLLRRTRSRPAWAALGGLLAVSILSREGSVLLVPLALAMLLGWGRLEGWRPPLGAFVCVSVLPIVLACLAWVSAAGDWRLAWEVLQANLRSPAQNAYALHYGSGPWFRYLVDFALLSPLTLLCYFAWCGRLTVSRGRTGEWVWAVLPLFFLLLSAPLTKNVRYALLLDLPIRLGAVLFLQGLLGDWEGNRRSALWMAVILLLLLWADLDIFLRIFVAGHLYDPMTAFLVWARGMLPRP